MARKARKWNPSLHPRDSKGRFTRSSTRVLKGTDSKRARSAVTGFKPAQIGAEDQARAWMEARTGKPLGTDSALSRYLAGGWRDTNKAVRANKTPPPEVKEIDAEIGELDEDVMLRRQVPLSMFAHIPVEDLVGMKVRDAAYASTSLDRPDAGPSAPDAVTMHIAAAKGTPAYVNAPDGEILLARDTEVAITRAEPNGRGGWDVYGVVIPKTAVKRDQPADDGKQDDEKSAPAPDGGASSADNSGVDAGEPTDGAQTAAGGTGGGRGSANDSPRAAATPDDRPPPRNDDEAYIRGFTDAELLTAARELAAGKRQMSARMRLYVDREVEHRGLTAERVAPELPDSYARPRNTGGATDSPRAAADPDTTPPPDGAPALRVKDYQRGWDASRLYGPDALDDADERGEPDAFYDGFEDHGNGRPKWTSLRYVAPPRMEYRDGKSVPVRPLTDQERWATMSDRELRAELAAIKGKRGGQATALRAELARRADGRNNTGRAAPERDAGGQPTAAATPDAPAAPTAVEPSPDDQRFLAGLTDEQLRNRLDGYSGGGLVADPKKAAEAQWEIDRRAAAPAPAGAPSTDFSAMTDAELLAILGDLDALPADRSEAFHAEVQRRTAARAAAAAPAPAGDATPTAGTSAPDAADGPPSPETMRAARDRLAASVASGVVEREELGGGTTATVERVTFADGREGIYKRADPDGFRAPKDQQDAEELGALVLAAFGVRSPAVHRDDTDAIYAEYVEGRTGMAMSEAIDDERAVMFEHLSGDSGRMMAAADVVMENVDRNAGNWIHSAGGELVGIDHGYAFLGTGEIRGAMLLHELERGDVSPADLAVVRERLTALRPEFDRLDRGDWHDATLARLDELAGLATGDRNRLADGATTGAPAPAAGTRTPAAPAAPVVVPSPDDQRFLAGLTDEQLRNRLDGYSGGGLVADPTKAAEAQWEIDRRATAPAAGAPSTDFSAMTDAELLAVLGELDSRPAEDAEAVHAEIQRRRAARSTPPPATATPAAGTSASSVDAPPAPEAPGTPAPAAAAPAAVVPRSPQEQEEHYAYEAVRRGFAMSGFSDDDLINAGRGARRAGDDDVLARVAEEQARRQDARFLTPAAAAAAAERRAAARRQADAPAPAPEAPPGPAEQTDIFGGVSEFVPAPRAAIGLPDRPNVGRERAIAAVQQLGMFDVSDQQQMAGQGELLDFKLEAVESLLAMPGPDPTIPDPPAPTTPPPAAVVPSAPASIVPDDLTGLDDEHLGELFRQATETEDADGAARIFGEWERREQAMRDLVASVPDDLTEVSEADLADLTARLTGEHGSLDQPTTDRLFAELDRRREADRVAAENAPKLALLARPVGDLTDDEIERASEYAADLDDVDAMERVAVEWDRRTRAAETRERIEREAREAVEREAALEAARAAERQAAAEHAAARRDQVVDAMIAAQAAAIIPEVDNQAVSAAVDALGDDGLRRVIGAATVDRWLSGVENFGPQRRQSEIRAKVYALPDRDRLRVVMAASDAEGDRDLAGMSAAELQTIINEGVTAGWRDAPDAARLRQEGRRAAREKNRRRVRQMQEDNAREFRAWQIRAMAADPGSLTDAELELAPTLVGASDPDGVDVPERLAALSAEARRREAAAAETAQAVMAGPDRPARLRNPVEAYGRLERMITGRTQKDAAAESRLRRAHLAVLGLPLDTEDRTLREALKTDPRSVPDRAAEVLAWYRHLAQHEGVDTDDAWWYRGPDDDPDLPDTPAPAPPANVAKAGQVWAAIRENARAELAAGEMETGSRYTRALARTYRIPAGGRDMDRDALRRVQADVELAIRQDRRPEAKRAADYIGNFRALAAEDGVDPSDTLRHGPPDKGTRRPKRPLARASTPEQEQRIDALVARGWDYLDAYADVHGVDRADVEAGGRSGPKESEIRAAYAEYVDAQYAAAEAATRGYLVKRRSEGKIDPRTLFSGAWSAARSHASEELLRWWGEHPRLTYADFKAQVTGRGGRTSRERMAAARKDNEFA
ncbi:hypothetical protein [Micromonospora sp. RP3T]|uniref:hypothetical protein n=1 Tax=Micromonospora sp. RP3T TaxID=2135446 RepID=UPI003D71A313